MDITTPSRSFGAYHLSVDTLRSLEAKGYRSPTDVQHEAIPLALEGKDLVVQSRTGTGKTAAFGVPIIEKTDLDQVGVQAVVLTPTRELAIQVSKEITELGLGRGVKVETIYGGDSMERQLEGIRAGAHVIVGTPGRVLDHLRRRTLDFGGVKTLVLDEADRMLDMGFAVEMGQIMDYVPEERHTMLFSATVPIGIRGLIYHYMAEPEWVLLSEDQIYVKEVEHVYCLTTRFQKEATLYKLIEYENPASSMIFCNTREETRKVATFLGNKGLAVAMLSSDLPQKKREKVMGRFRNGEIRHLVTTDVASRGIDIEDLSHVFIFSSPDSPEQYIHRAGRTGRVGKTGRAISLLSAMDLMNFNRLVKRYHVEVKEIAVPTDEDVLSRKAQRVVESLVEAGRRLSLEDLAELGPVARQVAEHELHDRIVAALLKEVLAKKAAVEDDPDEAEEQALPPRRRYDSGGGRGRGGDGGRRDGGRGGRRGGRRR
ncbi:MAG: DEAD/DEAH box helicase [Acidobacteria bacterium]|jgi:ATP-dependent RNA helicase DeaD|nr:DEAD/DEAH box helicase [Acidobacteriota bacterium]